MSRGWVTAAGIVAGTSGVLLMSRLWRSRSSRGTSDDLFASKYSTMLNNNNNNNNNIHCGHDDNQHSTENTEEGAQVLVFYASSSGNAEACAKGLVTDLRGRGVAAALIDPARWDNLAQFKLHCKQQQRQQQPKGEEGRTEEKFSPAGVTRADVPIMVFVVATTGEGEVPSNFLPLFTEMKSLEERSRNDERKPFEGLMYAVFALGDSSYKYYCRGGMDVKMLLKKGGGTEILPMGFGDARNPLKDDVFEDWEEKFMETIEKHHGVTLTAGSSAPPEPQLVFRLTPNKPLSAVPYPLPPSLLEPSMQHPAQLKLHAKTARTQRRDDGSYVLHVALDIRGYTVSYQAGDHLGIYPANPPEVVEAFRQVLNISEEDWLTPAELCTTSNARARASLRNSFPARVSLRTVFERYVDLCGKPRKSMLRTLAKYCTNPEEKTRFLNLLLHCGGGKEKNEADNEKNIVATSSTQNPSPPCSCSSSSSSLPANHSSLECRTLLDYMNKFPSCRCIPVGHFLEIISRIQPRFYSIASDIMTHPTRVEAFMRILPDGLNSQYMERVSVGEEVTAFIQKSTFHLPAKWNDKPVLMIAAGTGVASMVGFCHRREALMKKQQGGAAAAAAAYGPMILFFGAQKRKTEYFVKEEMERWCLHEEGSLQQDAHASSASSSLISLLDLAFSRDQPEKYYVTHLLEKHKDYIRQLLTSSTKGGCLLYLSGDASTLARSVDRALLKILQDAGMTRPAAAEFLRRMEQERRYLKDVY